MPDRTIVSAFVRPIAPPPRDAPAPRATWDAGREPVAAPPLWALGAMLLVLAGVWAIVFERLSMEWSVNTIYSYGYAVPFLCLYLLYERWRDRPAMRPASRLERVIATTLALALLLVLLPVRVIQEANPDWVKINWSMMGIAMGVTLCAMWRTVGFRTMCWLAFPVLFAGTALAWPVWMEQELVQSLMRANAVVSADLLSVIGHPAIARGNLIEIGSTVLNVEEACSGIRSLQTAFMVSLFFGEFYRYGIFVRLGLVAASFALAFVVNLARTVSLALIGGVQGTAGVDRWHDHIGLVGMVVCLAGLWALADGFSRFQRSRAERAASAAGPGSTRPAVTAAPSPADRSRFAPWPIALSACGVVWLLGVIGLTEAWYRSHESANSAPVEWSLAWPYRADDFRRAELPDRTRAIMKFNEGSTASWRGEAGNQWMAYYMRWEPGRVSKFLAGAHYPTVCLPATGLQLVKELEPTQISVKGITVPLRRYIFDHSGHNVYVFHAIMEDVPEAEQGRIVYRQAKSEERLASVMRGERNLGQRVMGIAVSGPRSEAEALEKFETTLGQLMRRAGEKVAHLP